MEDLQLFVPINSSDAEMKMLFKSVARVKTFGLLLTSIGFLPTKPTRVYEDNEAVTSSVTTHRITRRSRHIDIPLCFMHDQQAKRVFEVIKVGSESHSVSKYGY